MRNLCGIKSEQEETELGLRRERAGARGVGNRRWRVAPRRPGKHPRYKCRRHQLAHGPTLDTSPLFFFLLRSQATHNIHPPAAITQLSLASLSISSSSEALFGCAIESHCLCCVCCLKQSARAALRRGYEDDIT